MTPGRRPLADVYVNQSLSSCTALRLPLRSTIVVQNYRIKKVARGSPKDLVLPFRLLSCYNQPFSICFMCKNRLLLNFNILASFCCCLSRTLSFTLRPCRRHYRMLLPVAAVGILSMPSSHASHLYGACTIRCYLCHAISHCQASGKELEIFCLHLK